MNDLTSINAFVSGAVALGFWAISVQFQRFWRRTRIRLFNLFAFAFLLMALERVVMVVTHPPNDFAPYLYLLRLAAYVTIIAAIINHNRGSKFT